MVIEAARRPPEMREGARDRLLAMRSLGIFADLDEDGATLLAEYSKLTSFKASERVTRADREVASVFVVIDGLIDVVRGSAKLEIGSGRAVGLLGTVSRTAIGVDAVARRATRTLEIPRGAFLGAMEENFSLLRNVLRTVAGTLLDARGNLPLGTGDPGPGSVRPGPTPVGAQSLVQRVLEVGRTPLFADANIDSVFDVARALREVRVPAGHVFWSIGDAPTASVRIVSGRVRCTTEDGRHVDVSGDYMLGTLNALAGRPEGYEVRALEPVFAYTIDFEDFLVVLEAHPELGMGLLASLAKLLLKTT